jgi:hypothetical protein
LKELVVFPAWEIMSRFWKKDILVEYRFLEKGEPRQVCGVAMDPAKFIPKYLMRFLERRQMEEDLPPAGNYAIKIKVNFTKMFFGILLKCLRNSIVLEFGFI